MQHVNIDWDYIRTTLTTNSASNGLDFEVRETLETRLAVIESDSNSITLALTETWRRYALDPNVAVDPDLPIEVFEGDVVEREILSTEINPVTFSANELLGTWVIRGLNQDDYDLAARCIFSGGYRYNRSECSDHITFFDDNTAVLEHSGRTALWAIADDSSITVDFGDNGTRVSLLRIAKGDDTSSVLVSFETEEEYYAKVNMMIKESVPEPRSLTSFLDQGFLMHSFGVTNDTSVYRRSLIDGGYIGGFGFKLNSDGTGGRYDINNSVSTLDSGRDVITGFSNELPITWAQDGNTITSSACLNRVGEEGSCYQEQVRTWELIKTTATRFYVNEVLAWRFDYDADGEVDEESIYASRPNFYELVPYYDTNDLDRDGYPNNIDAFPTDERQFQDADGDGIGDNPLMPGDIDGDGVEDTFDTFPLDAAESADNDADGLGDNRDTDDDNDGYSDTEEIAAGTDPLDINSYPGTPEEETGGTPIWMLYTATKIAAERNQPVDAPLIGKCDEDIFGRVDCNDSSTISLPYGSSGSQSISRLPKPAYFSFGTYVVSAESANYRVAELTAEDRNGRVSPDIDGLDEGQLINQGQSIQFELLTPPTDGQQTNLRFFLRFEGGSGQPCDNCTFSFERVFTSN